MKEREMDWYSCDNSQGSCEGYVEKGETPDNSMKKFISTILIITAAMAMSFAAPKEKKSGNIKLDPKKKFAIEGVELGSIDWCQNDAKLTPKGEIIWNTSLEGDWRNYGWDLRGTDMSKYAGLRIELTTNDYNEFHIGVSNPAVLNDWNYNVSNDGVAYVMFDGSNIGWGEMKDPDPEEGFEIRLYTSTKKNPKTTIKSIELIKKEDIPDTSNLKILGVPFGTSIWKTHVIGNEVIWTKGDKGGDAGWNLSGIDLSEYDRVRVELESNTAKHIGLRLVDPDHHNWHGFDNQVEPNVFEADLSGEGASWVEENGTNLDKSKGLKIILQTFDRTKEERTIVKSIQLLKGKRVANENLMIGNSVLGSSGWNSNVYDGGVIEWIWDGKDKYPTRGWNVKNIDFSEWKTLRIEFSPETPASNHSIKLYQEKNDSGVYFYSKSNTIIEANLDGSNANGKWENKGKWDTSKKIDQIWISYENLSKSGEKAIIKSVTLLKEGEGTKQPAKLLLNGKELGSHRDNNAWLDDDFAINWKKANYTQCGWSFENLEGDILEVKVSSTDVPLNFRIREYAHGNEASWLDDGSHIFRINLKTKKQINEKGGQKAPSWEKMTKAFDFSEGGEIVLEPANGVYKDGKKTVVEYIRVE